MALHREKHERGVALPERIEVLRMLARGGDEGALFAMQHSAAVTWLASQGFVESTGHFRARVTHEGWCEIAADVRRERRDA